MASKPPSTKYFVGVRDPESICHDIWGTVRMSTGRYNKLMMRAATEQYGIKKSRLGEKMNFYALEEKDVEQYASEGSSTLITLTYGKQWNPLLLVDRFKMRECYESTVKKYEELLNKSRGVFDEMFVQSLIENNVITKISDEQPVIRKRQWNIHNIKVGDYVDLHSNTWYHSEYCKVIRTSESGFWYQLVGVEQPSKEILSEKNLFLEYINKYKEVSIENVNEARYDIYIPFENNEKHMTLSNVVKYKRWNENIQKTKKITMRVYYSGDSSYINDYII
jgi:hypothetical protein